MKDECICIDYWNNQGQAYDRCGKGNTSISDSEGDDEKCKSLKKF